MTAFHFDKDHVIKRSKLAGLDDVVYKKPIDPPRLRDIIKRHARRPDSASPDDRGARPPRGGHPGGRR